MTEQLGPHPRVVSRVVGAGGEVLAQVTERVRALRRVSHPGVLLPTGLGVGARDQVVVNFPWLDGVDLAELETRRAPLTAGECVWLGVRVAQALAQMHAAGIAHGDISPGNIVVANGAVVLVDTVAGSLPSELGTVGFRAPEREKHGASAAGDVYSLGALLRWCVAEDQRVMIEAWTAPLLALDPTQRPPVDIAQRALASCAAPQEVAIPARAQVVPAIRARAKQRTVRIVDGPRSRWRRTGLRVGLGLAVCIAVGTSAVAVPRFIDTIGSSDAQMALDVPHLPSVAPSAEPRHATFAPSPAPPDAGQAAAALTEQRFAALASADGDQLRATVSDGPLAHEVQTLSRALSAREVRYAGLRAVVTTVEVLEQSADNAVVYVVYDVSEHTVITPGGEHVVAAHTQAVELDLIFDDGWTVHAARPAP